MTDAYLDAAATAAALIGSAEVGARWDEPSALPEMRVSSLAGHLARQFTNVPGLLSQPGPLGAELISVHDHYARVAWIGAPPDAEVNVAIREDSDAEAADGPAALARRAHDAVATLRTLLPAEEPDRPLYLPWTGWSLPLADFLTTRLLEIVVHIDDLAVSVGVAPPALPERATDPVLALLTRMAARRHGPTAVLRALTRAERAPATIAAI
jgi:hypothetical protein